MDKMSNGSKRTPGAVTPTSPDNLPELAPEHTLSGTREKVGGIFDLAHETVAIQMGAMDLEMAQESMRKLAAFMHFVKALAFSQLTEDDFTSFASVTGDSADKGKPWLKVGAAERVAEICGIDYGLIKMETEEGEDEAGKWFLRRATMFFRLGARQIQAMGEIDSRDGFLSHGGKLSASKVPRTRIGQKAVSRATQVGVGKILGLRDMTWDKVKELCGEGFDPSKVKVAGFEKGGQGGGGKQRAKAGCVPGAQVWRVYSAWCKMGGLSTEDAAFKKNIGPFSEWVVSIIGDSAKGRKWDAYTQPEIDTLLTAINEIPR
jgi:hypothetical protein